MNLSEMLPLARRIADATGEQVLIGVRPSKFSTTYFAHCNGVEVDASTATDAVVDLASRMLDKLEGQQQVASRLLGEAQRGLAVLREGSSE